MHRRTERPGELAVGDCTDGHIDGLACFTRPGMVLLETLTEPGSERSKVLRENRLALQGVTDARGRQLEFIEMEDAWQAKRESDTFCASYINFYVANGGVIMPSYNAPGDEPARRIVADAFPDHEVVQVDVRKIAIAAAESTASRNSSRPEWPVRSDQDNVRNKAALPST
jgi:agmatine deiminase